MDWKTWLNMCVIFDHLCFCGGALHWVRRDWKIRLWWCFLGGWIPLRKSISRYRKLIFLEKVNFSLTIWPVKCYTDAYFISCDICNRSFLAHSFCRWVDVIFMSFFISVSPCVFACKRRIENSYWFECALVHHQLEENEVGRKLLLCLLSKMYNNRCSSLLVHLLVCMCACLCECVCVICSCCMKSTAPNLYVGLASCLVVVHESLYAVVFALVLLFV